MLFHNLSLVFCAFCRVFAAQTFSETSNVFYRRARVECGGSFCRGMVVADLREHPIEAPGVSICVDVDSRRALEELLTTFMA